MKRFLRFIIGVGLLVVIFFIVVNSKANKDFEQELADTLFVVDAGQGVNDIAENLKEKGIIDSPFWFKVYVYLKGNRSDFYEGTFYLEQVKSMGQLVETLTTQKPLAQEVEITILEGWRVDQIDEYLAQKKLISAGELIKYSEDFTNSFALQKIMEYDWPLLKEKPINVGLEGFLYPDTYRVYQQSSVEEIVVKMINNFHSKFNDTLREELERQNKSLYEVLTLASVVEKEMFGYENRQKVADVFQKRLDVGMALQSDATVNYITRKGTDRPSIKDTQVDSPYNTYKHPGLPPTPISNPSIEAIKSVLYPIENDYWYFLTTRDGQIIFGETHDEHLMNINKYLN